MSGRRPVVVALGTVDPALVTGVLGDTVEFVARPGPPGLASILGIGTDGILAVSALSAAALTLTSLLVVGLGAVLRSAAGTITTALAVCSPRRSWVPWCPTSSSPP